jgi:hypothetical protein
MLPDICNIRNNQILLSADLFGNEEILFCVGVKSVQDFFIVPRYNQDLTNNYFFKCDDSRCQISKRRSVDERISQGAPYDCQISMGQINITGWVSAFSKDIMKQVYKDAIQDFKEIDMDPLITKNPIRDEAKDDIQLKVVIDDHNVINNGRGVQLHFRSYVVEKQSEINHSIEYVINLAILDKTPMIARIGDQRIGYFYTEKIPDDTDLIFHRPKIVICRKNTTKIPWTYVINDYAIDKKWIPSIELGVVQWNQYFEKLEVEQPLRAVCRSEIDDCNLFDMEHGYIDDHSNFGPAVYYGVSEINTDIRSGEIICGNIYINFKRVIAAALRHIRIFSEIKINEDAFISNAIAWIVGHEIGHQLGLRHNFVGNLVKHGSIMDYYNLQFGYKALKDLEHYDITDIRPYDQLAVTYGYAFIPTEVSMVKNPSLTKLLDENAIPFKSDENLMLGVNPLVDKQNTQNNLLDYIETQLDAYKNIRLRMLNDLKSGDLDYYQYANAFLHVYDNEYFKMINTLSKFIGGRLQDFEQYTPIPPDVRIDAIELLIDLKNDFKYTSDEYENFIYEPVIPSKNHVNMIDSYYFYGYNRTNLFYLYEKLADFWINQISGTDVVVRYLQDNPDNSYLYDITFCYSGGLFNIDAEGIFPEIGMMIENNKKWKQKITSSTCLCSQYLQYTWVKHITKHFRDPKCQLEDNYLKLNEYTRIIATIEKYVDIIIKNSEDTGHWNLIKFMINKVD